MNDLRVYSYVNKDTYEFLKEIKEKLLEEKYLTSSISKIIYLSTLELKENNSYDEIKMKLVSKEMI